jgi:hypothetical protein
MCNRIKNQRHLRRIFYFLVLAEIRGGVDEIGEEQHLRAQRDPWLHIEVALDFAPEQSGEPVAVVVVHQSILKDSATFVIPQTHQQINVLQIT